ncbi:MAG: hypothetical protein HY660_03625 [Armatimonadetes bacterium]|nr:hypothetical protein [Armatimonadota bacterium]
MTSDSALHTVPSVWRRLWDGWKVIARKIGDFQARLLLTVLYFAIVAPFALAVRWSRDPLAIKPGTPRGWRPRDTDASSMDWARRQFP